MCYWGWEIQGSGRISLSNQSKWFQIHIFYIYALIHMRYSAAFLDDVMHVITYREIDMSLCRTRFWRQNKIGEIFWQYWLFISSVISLNITFFRSVGWICLNLNFWKQNIHYRVPPGVFLLTQKKESKSSPASALLGIFSHTSQPDSANACVFCHLDFRIEILWGLPFINVSNKVLWPQKCDIQWRHIKNLVSSKSGKGLEFLDVFSQKDVPSFTSLMKTIQKTKEFLIYLFLL